jgi:hypothetical protein
MLENNKGEFVRICYDDRGTRLGQALVGFLEFLQDEARRKNDEAEGVEVSRYQGEIRAYKKLLNYFLKKMPEKENIA